MPKKKSNKAAVSDASKSSGDNYAAQQITIQEPRPGSFKLTLGKHDGLVWGCYTAQDIAIKQLKKDFLKSIDKSPNSYLTHVHIDDFQKFLESNGFRIKMPLIEWKKNFSRRFQRYLEKEGITLEQIEKQGFSGAASKRWLRNLYKNGIYQTKGVASGYMVDLCLLLGVESTDDF